MLVNGAQNQLDLSKNTPLTLQETVSKFRILKASDLLSMRAFEPHQNLNFEWMDPSNCYLLLFVSHRWESSEHPDPMGKQLFALKSLINFICRAAEALSADTHEERLSHLPSLREHGALQATILLSRLSSSALNLEANVSETPILEWMPEHIGIWYDFACLPQPPRSFEQENEFKRVLTDLPRLLLSQEISLVALREEADDYEQRGWCFAEARLASSNMSFAPVKLACDRLGTMLDFQILNKSPQIVSEAGGSSQLQFEAALAAWEFPEKYLISPEECWEIIVFQSCLTPDALPMPEFDSPMLGTSKFAHPANTWIGLLVAELAAQGDQVFDFSNIALNILKEKKLYCSEDKDLIYVGLLALLWSCSEKSRLRKLLQQSLERHINDETLLMKVSFVENSHSDKRKSANTINSDNLNWTFIDNV